MFKSVKSLCIRSIALTFLASYVAAQGNVFVSPLQNSYVGNNRPGWTESPKRFLHRSLSGVEEYVGSNFDITWNADTDTTGLVSLNLGSGHSSNIDIVFNIATDIPNSGVLYCKGITANSKVFGWSVPTNIPSRDDYTIQIAFDGYKLL